MYPRESAMAIGGFGGATTHIFPSLGPAILVSMTYIDLGKWLVAVEGGARFGFELVLTVLIFNCIAILCQFLSTGIGMVTRKNLAEICSEEYTKLPCLLLGVQAELSMIISDLTMVLGIAQGVNLLFGMDLLSCILFAILGAILLPFLINLSDNNGKAAEFFVYIAAFALLFYVFGVLISQPEVPVIDEFLPKLSRENAYAVMALLGANIMSHNFYIHSAIIQVTTEIGSSQSASTGDLVLVPGGARHQFVSYYRRPWLQVPEVQSTWSLEGAEQSCRLPLQA